MVAFLVYLFLFGFTNLFLLFCFLLGSVFPDVDSKNSFINRYLKFLPLYFLVGHRTIFHSFFFPFFYFLIAFFCEFESVFVNYFFLGYVVHLILDAFTLRGVNFLYPFRFEVRGFVRVGSSFEKVLFFVSFLLVLFYFVRDFVF